ncbi:WS/DGAT/MGAT family O-acyltransferase [Pseudoxanthomonas wuyuanensis]|uniref:diacylglycerol O-acyltransferase n=1 Tax=Pseudoxanthomonas wuyuanensis TaxID=1073196 RepID=A0A286CY25_9GAMM|nr:wax ester/triacylglycerol synthase family O-acyltransferase [Pseudoxanthomonas wuyuanensis]KAF1722673.1 wax ester/triacylglycerol synthase family O-acyltransferase [Pseudoxanthomonas wuyuanensis]SOD51290.1 acyltransferase, WS/DGAT/MGAT [Pseudoxanthomonas wuyuanensis]
MATKQALRKPRREPMSRVDTAWLRMCRPTNPMMITGVLMFDEPMTLERLKQVIRKRFLAYPRFWQKAVDTPAGASWVEDADFDLDWHVRISALPGRGDPRSEKRALERFVSQMASTPLDKTKPLWQFHLVEKYGSGSALVARIHHSYADGIALVQVLLSLTDTTRKPDSGSELRAAWLKKDGVEVVRRVGAIDRYVKLGGKVLDKGMEMYRDPSLAAVLAKEGGEIGRELLSALALSDDPPTLLRGRLGVSKRVAWAEPLNLDEVKAVGRACDCTVNDVLMAAAAGALRGYLIERGENLDGITLRATVPVNLRPLEHAKKLGNHFGLVFLELPVGEDNPMRRLEHVASCMQNLKNSRQAIVAFGLLAALGMAPTALQSVALELFSRKASAVATNVPGPQQPLYMGGCQVREMMFWVPQTGSIGLGVSILSYNNRVHFGLIADAKLIPDPDAVIRRFGPEFEKLLFLSLMGDWDHAMSADAAAALLPAS